MSTKKPASNQKRSRQTPGVTSAIKRGRAQAAAVVALRARHRRKRTQAISGLTEISRRYLKRPIPILTHGYDYPIPDGRGFLGGWGPLPGPWLRPGFRQKGYADQVENAKVMRDLIDAFNELLGQVSIVPQFQHVRYIDLRATLAGDRTYRKDWANELHPTGRGFAAVTEKFANVIAGL
jgi:hypothetical protein